MIKNGVYVGEIELEFYGTQEGSCAWCDKLNANEWYTDETSNGRLAIYNVCESCFYERTDQ